MRLQMIVLAVFVCGITIGVRPAAAACSNATLTGVYGYSHGRQGGLFLGTQVVVGQFTADGQGHLTGGSWISTVSGGSITIGLISGTYSISSNCIGTLTFKQEDSGTSSSHFKIYLDDSHQAFQMIQSDSNSTQPGFGASLGTATCGLTGKKQILAANILGLDPSDYPEAIAGQFKLDGNGNVSGSVTIANNGEISKVALAGTYTQHSTCIGTMQITPTGFTAMNFTTFAVNENKELLLIETDTNSFRTGTAQQ
ncbi:MAG: hypothetical protein WB952_00305 [Terriglobales bacterium]